MPFNTRTTINTGTNWFSTTQEFETFMAGLSDNSNTAAIKERFIQEGRLLSVSGTVNGNVVTIDRSWNSQEDYLLFVEETSSIDNAFGSLTWKVETVIV